MKSILTALLFLSPLSSFAAEQITGVGISLAQEKQSFVVAGLVQGAPAQRDGTIHAGDELVAVKLANGTWASLERVAIDDVVGMIRGTAGEPVALHLSGAKGQYEVNLIRETFEVP